MFRGRALSHLYDLKRKVIRSADKMCTFREMEYFTMMGRPISQIPSFVNGDFVAAGSLHVGREYQSSCWFSMSRIIGDDC